MSKAAVALLPRYRCHKEVSAVKISEVIHYGPPPLIAPAYARIVPCGEAPSINISEDWFEKHNPQAGGYYVLYDDGYASYSPAKVFESGYSKITKRKKQHE